MYFVQCEVYLCFICRMMVLRSLTEYLGGARMHLEEGNDFPQL